jgi:hypothetical protein
MLSSPLRLSLSILLMMAMLGLLSVRSARAADQVPFHGTFITVATVSQCPPATMCVELSGPGEATHLGRAEILKHSASTRTSELCPGGAVNTYTADLTLFAANGDTITMSGNGTVCQGPNHVEASGTYSVTGGTGRFDGAGGTITERFERVGDLVYVTLTGAISSTGSSK